MGNNTIQTAPASAEAKVPAEKQAQTFIDEKELLTRLPICRRTVFNWIRQGKLPCVKIGRRKIFHWKSCEEALLRLQRKTA
jgi:predicted DNA-binding transcriptional regulator AlpA